MLYALLFIFSCSAQDPIIGSLKIESFSPQTSKLPRSSMETLTLSFSIEINEGIQIPLEPALVNLLVYRYDDLWKNITTQAFEWQSGDFSNIFLPEGEFYLSLYSSNLNPWIGSRFYVEEPRADLRMNELAKDSFLMVSNKFCFTLLDQFQNLWNQSVKNFHCSTGGADLAYEGDELCVNQIFMESGAGSMYVECNEEFFEFGIYVNKLEMRFEKFQAPSFSTDYLNASIVLVCNDTRYVEEDGNFQVSIEIRENKLENDLPCSGFVLDGAINSSFHFGKANFEMIKVLSNGRFELAVVSFGFPIIFSQRFMVTNFIKSVELYPSSEPMHFHYFEMLLNAIGDDGNLFKRQFDLEMKFNDFYCISHTYDCYNSICYKCLPLRLRNETILLKLVDKVYESYIFEQNHTFTVLFNPNAKVMIYIHDSNNYYPYPSMNYDSIYIRYYIQDDYQLFHDIPCYVDNNYIERKCISERCSYNESVEKIPTYCNRYWYDQTYSYTDWNYINSIGEYVYSIPFINDLTAEKELISISSFVYNTEFYNIENIYSNEESTFILKLNGPDGFPYIKCNDVKIDSNGLESNLTFRLCEGYLESSMTFNSNGQHWVKISSTHMKETSDYLFFVEQKIERKIKEVQISTNLNTTDLFYILFTTSSIYDEDLDCLPDIIIPTIKFINKENNEQYKINPEVSCENKTYNITSLSIVNPGKYSVEIHSDQFKRKILDSQIIVEEKIYDITINPLQAIYKNHPFEISFNIFSSPSTSFQSKNTFLLESESIFGQNTSVNSKCLLKFYIFCSIEGSINLNIKDSHSAFSKDFVLDVKSNNGKQLLISSISPIPSDSSDFFKIQVNCSGSAGNFEYIIGLIPIDTVSGSMILGATTKISNETLIEFENLNIESSGTFLISVNSSDNISGTSYFPIIIKNRILNLTLETSSEIAAYTEATFVVRIFGEDENLYIGNIEVLLIVTDFIGEEKIFANYGEAVFKGYFNKTGAKIITARIKESNFSVSVVIVIIDPKFSAVFEKISPIPSLSKDFFNCSVKIVDSFTQKKMMGIEKRLRLSLIPVDESRCSGSVIQGDIEVNSIDGIANFVNIKILSSGKFKLAANYSSVEIGYSRILPITNFIHSTKIINPEEPYFVYDIVYYRIAAYGDDNNIFLRYINSYIQSSSGVAITGQYFDYGYHSIWCYSYITCMGNYTIELMIYDFENFLNEYEIVSAPNPYAYLDIVLLDYYRDYPFPSLSSDYFGGFEQPEYICIQLKSLSMDYMFYYYNSFCNKLSVNILCESGSCSSEKLEYEYFDFYRWLHYDHYHHEYYLKCFKVKILSNGDFKLIFSLPGAKDVVLSDNGREKILNITNFVKSITFQTIYLNPIVNEDFQVLFLVYGDDDVLYSKKNNLTISSDCFSEETIVLCEKGIALTNLTFTITGSCSINVKSTHNNQKSWTFNVTSQAKDSSKTKSLEVNPIPKTSDDQFNITLNKESIPYTDSFPNLTIMPQDKSTDSVIKCAKITNDSLSINYNSCRILSSGSFFIVFQNIIFDETLLKISNKVKSVLSVSNKSQVLLNELFEVKALVLGEDNLTYHNFASIEISNNEIIGQKRSTCKNNQCTFLVSCIKEMSFNLIYIIYSLNNDTQYFESSMLRCIAGEKNFMSLSLVQNTETLIQYLNASSVFEINIQFHLTNINKYINQPVQIKILPIIENYNQENILILNTLTLENSSLIFDNMTIENPGKYLVFACLSNILHISSFIYRQELIVKSPASYIKIFLPERISEITNSKIEVKLFSLSNDLYTDQSFEVTLVVKDTESKEYKSTIKKGVSLFLIKLLLSKTYSFSARVENLNFNDSIQDVTFEKSEVDYSLKILGVNSEDLMDFPSLSWDSSYILVGVYDISGTIFLNSVNGLILNLSLVPISKFSGSIIEGALYTYVTNGIANFTNIFIKSSGFFEISVICMSCIETKSQVFEITNFLINYGCVGCPVEKKYPIYKINDLFINTTADDLNKYKRPINVNFYDVSNIIINLTSVEGQIKWYGYKLGRASFKFSILSQNYSFEFEIVENPDSIIIITENIVPRRSSDSFYIDVTLPNDFSYILFNFTIELVTLNRSKPLMSTSTTNIIKDWDRMWEISYWYSEYLRQRFCRFSNIRIYNSGFSYIRVTMPGLRPANSNLFNITNYVKEIIVNVDNFTVPMYYSVDLAITLIAEDDDLYKNFWSMIIMADNLVGDNNLDNYNLTGLISREIMFDTPGQKQVKIYSENNLVNTTFVIEVLNKTAESRCSISFPNGKPSTSRDLFSIRVSLVDFYEGVEKDYKRGGEVSLELDSINETNLSGTVISRSGREKILNSKAEFNDISVYSSGFFYFTAQPQFSSPCTSEGFSVTNFIKRILVKSSHKAQSANFDISLEISLLGDDENPFLGNDLLLIHDKRLSEIKGTNSLFVSNPSLNATIYFPSVGVKYLQINSTISKATSSVTIISISKQKLVLSQTQVSSTNINPQSFKVDVCNTEGTLIESQHSNYTITLSTQPVNRLKGELTVQTINGTALFTNLYAIKPGIFSVYSNKKNFIESGQFGINIEHFLQKMNFTFTSFIQTSVIFNLQVTLLKSDNSLFKYPCIVSLYSDGLKGNLTKNNTNGVVIFEIYFETEGDKTITANCSVFQDSTDVNVKVFTTTDDLCINPFNASHCQVCMKKSFPIDGRCECIKNSIKRKVVDGCYCISNSFEYENVCYADQRRFFKPSQLHGYFSEDYKNIIVDFDTRTDAMVGSSCITQISFPETLEDQIINCIWKTDSTFEISLQKVLLDSNLTIKVNGFKVYSLTNTISYDLKELSVLILKKFNYPTPTAQIISPSNISSQCNSENIDISSKEKNSLFNYSWAASSTPWRKEIESFINSTKSFSFTIPSQLLLPTQLQLFLTVSDPIFNTKSEAFHRLSISSSKILIVSFSNPGPLKYSLSDEFLIQSVVKESCGTQENYNYTWGYSLVGRTPDIDFQKILLNRQRAGSLKILQNSLSVGQYSFTVKASSQSISGSSSVDVEIESSPLSLTLSKSNGTVSGNLDVTIYATAMNPDDLEEMVNVDWTCNEQASGFKIEGNDLILMKNAFRDKTYTFTATATTSSKRLQKALSLTVDNQINTDVSLQSFDRKINIDEEIKLVTTIRSTGQPSFEWSIEEPVTLPYISSPYLLIPANTLVAGKAYKVTVKATVSEYDKTESSIWINTNMNPSCSGVSVETIKNKLKLIAKDCQDPDDDMPLTYIFGIRFESKNLWITNTLFSSTLTTSLPSFTKQVFCKVCDDLHSCKIYFSSNLTLRTRHLNSFSSEFLSEVRNPELVPVNILIYSGKAETVAELQLVFEVFYDYFMGEIMSEDTFNIFYECYQAIFVRDELASDEMMRNGTDFILGMTEKEGFEISKENSEKLLRTIKIYKDRLTVAEVVQCIGRIANRMFNGKLPQDYLEVEKTLVIIKEIGSQLPGLSLKFESMSIEIPSTSIFDELAVYDIQIIQFQTMNTSVIDLKLLYSGSYHEFSLKNSALNDSWAELDQIINLKIQGEFNKNLSYDCLLLNQSTSNQTCKVDKISKKSIKLKVSAEGSFIIMQDDKSESFESSDESCKIGYYNIGIMVGVFVVSLSLATLSLIFGTRDQNKSDVVNMISIFLPSSFFYTIKRTSKLISLLEMMTIFYILLLIMNVVISFMMNIPEDISFDQKSLKAAVISWAICQSYSILIYFVFRTNQYANMKPLVFIMLFSSILFICVLLITIISTKYCLGYSLAILQLYLVLLGLEIMIELVYAFGSLIIMKLIVTEPKSSPEISFKFENCQTTDRGKELCSLEEVVPPSIIPELIEENSYEYKICLSVESIIAQDNK